MEEAAKGEGSSRWAHSGLRSTTQWNSASQHTQGLPAANQNAGLWGSRSERYLTSSGIARCWAGNLVQHRARLSRHGIPGSFKV